MKTTDFEYKLLSVRPAMIRIAADFFHDREDAEDVVQEVCVRMLERGWHEGDNVEALAVRATKNLCVSIWKRQKLRKEDSIDAARTQASEASADERMLHAERQQLLDDAILRLPPTEQKLIRLRQQELTTSEISQQTGIPPRSVSVMLCTAKKRLLNLLKDNSQDDR